MIQRCFLGVVIFCLLGLASSEAGTLVNFQGNANVVEKKLNLNLRFQDNSFLAAEFTPISEKSFYFKGTIDHLKTPLFDISSELKGTMDVVLDEKTAQPFLRGTIESKYSLLNYKPVKEVRGFFEIRNERLYLKNLSAGGFVFEGYLGFLPPFDLGLTIQMTGVSTDELSMISVMSGCPETSLISGMTSGRIYLSGFSDRMMIRGKIAAFGGSLQGLAYDNIVVNFDGMYPNIQITESMITEENGLSFHLEGQLNLTNHCNLLEGLTALKMSPLINENSLHREWTIKRQQDTQTSATEFKYRLQKQDHSADTQDNSDMLSVERSIKF